MVINTEPDKNYQVFEGLKGLINHPDVGRYGIKNSHVFLTYGRNDIMWQFDIENLENLNDVRWYAKRNVLGINFTLAMTTVEELS